MNVYSTTLFALSCLLVAPLRPAYAASLDAAQAKRIGEQFVAGKAAGSQEEYEATEVVVADLDKDGQDEVVVWWTMYGPTYSNAGVAVLAKQGQRYVLSGETQEPLGNVEGISVVNGVVQLRSKWPGPNDPRCCPSVTKTLRYQWIPGKLTPAK